MDALTINKRQRVKVVVNMPPQLSLVKNSRNSHGGGWYDKFFTKMTIDGDVSKESIEKWLKSQSNFKCAYYEFGNGYWYFLNEKNALEWIAERFRDNEYEYMGYYSLNVFTKAFQTQRPTLYNTLSQYYSNGVLNKGCETAVGKLIMESDKGWSQLVTQALFDLYSVKQIIINELSWETCECDVDIVKGETIYSYESC